VTDAVAAAAALRRLNHAVIGHVVDGGLLARIASDVGALADEAEARPSRRRPADGMIVDVNAAVGPNGIRPHYDDCPIDGATNPLSSAVDARFAGGELVATVTLGPAHEGAPGRSHGGVVAALVDDVMGMLVAGVLGVAAFQGELRVRFNAPVPIGEPLTLRARVDGRDGRKLLVGLTITAGEIEVVSASGLHVEPSYLEVTA
jgi:acyl-coenzyme A thioesterase PaaI-like protein